MSAPAPPPGPAAAPTDDADEAALAALGHDIRAALSDVLGGLRLIDPARVDAATRAQLDRIGASAELLARLAERCLGAMPGAGGDEATAANIPLARFLGDVQLRWSARAREKGLVFVLTVEGEVPPVISADRIGLERVLSNLLSNAVRHAESGRVLLSVRRLADAGIAFAVEDDGPGFSPAALGALFTPGARPPGSANPGPGLGLHIANELATRAGGTLALANRPQGGARVTLTLPPASCAPCCPLPRPADGAALPDLSRHRVLVAEDSGTNQIVLRRMLEGLGAEVTLASDGVEALQALARERFDLALIDIEMPGLSGLEVIRALRGAAGPQGRIPVLAVTAYVLRANREAIYAAGADAIQPKPVAGREALGRAIARLLQRTADTAPPPPEAAGAPRVALDQFDRLMEVAGPDTAPELLRRLAADLRHVERQVTAALPGPDWPELRAQTHVLIALAGAVGAVQLLHAAEALNETAHRRDGAALAAGAEGLLPLLDDLIGFVDRRIAGGRAA